VKKAGAVFGAGFFQAAVDIIKKKSAEGYLDRFPQRRQFPQASPSKCSFFLLLFLSCGNPNV
jgi:hypothetical protein